MRGRNSTNSLCARKEHDDKKSEQSNIEMSSSLYFYFQCCSVTGLSAAGHQTEDIYWQKKVLCGK